MPWYNEKRLVSRPSVLSRGIASMAFYGTMTSIPKTSSFDADDPKRITSIIDWQATLVYPMFLTAAHPALLDSTALSQKA
jgi:hypothetical protein